jgi:hypothetical protein
MMPQGYYWMLYRSKRRAPKYHLFVRGLNESICGNVNRGHGSADQLIDVLRRDTTIRTCVQCKRWHTLRQLHGDIGEQ